MKNADLIIVNNTSQDVRPFHGVIVEAIRNGGQFDEDYSDIFSLRRTDENVAANESGREAWILEMA